MRLALIALLAVGAVSASAQSRFHLEVEGKHHTLVSPEGQAYWALGINHIGDTTGRHEVAANLRAWGFNCAGGGVRGPILAELPYFATVNLTHCGHYLAASDFQYDDVFSETFAKDVERRVRMVCDDHRKNPRLIGYYWTDTPRWDLDIARKRRGTDWVSTLRQRSADTAGKQAYVDFLRDRFEHSIKAFNLAFRMEAASFDALLSEDFKHLELVRPDIRKADDAFLGVIAEKLYQLTHAAFERHDPEALLFGEKYKGHDHPAAVLKAAAAYVDVISVQPGPELGPLPGPGRHESTFDRAYFEQLHADTGKPIMICDHAISWHTEARPVTLWHQYPSAKEAIESYDTYLTQAASQPYIIGYCRCQYLSEYRKDRQLLKQGLLDEQGAPYQAVIEGISQTNSRVLRDRLRESSGRFIQE